MINSTTKHQYPIVWAFIFGLFALAIHRFLSNRICTKGAGFCFGAKNAESNIAGTHPGAEDVLTSQLLHWLHNNEAYINEKVNVGRVVPDDQASSRGVFAIAPMDAGETVCRIPWSLILKPNDFQSKKKTPSQMSDCDTILAVKEAMSGDTLTPYGSYLLAQPERYTAGFWSEPAQDLFIKMLSSERQEHQTEHDELPPHGVRDIANEEVKQECDGDVDDPLYLHAAMLVKSRADYQFMVPFYDLHNHHNGKFNLKHRFDPYKQPDNPVGYEIVTTKAVPSGEQLFLSYNHCNICYERYDWFGTPEMFLRYGFVEELPQRWLFDFARVKFDLDYKRSDDGNDESNSTGEVVVNFLVPPSEKGMSLLQEELTRLKFFSTTHRGMDHQAAGIAKNEWESIWQYHDALCDALSHAVESKALLTDEVWNRGDDWWVQDGTLVAADQDEHWVLPTTNIQL